MLADEQKELKQKKKCYYGMKQEQQHIAVSRAKQPLYMVYMVEFIVKNAVLDNCLSDLNCRF